MASGGDDQMYAAANMRESGMLQQIFQAPTPLFFRAYSNLHAVVPVIQVSFSPFLG
jgi:hypothetical protein